MISPVRLAGAVSAAAFLFVGGLAVAQTGSRDDRLAQPVSPPWHEDPRQPPRWGNGHSTNLVFSQDNRQVRLIAFESDATNLVPGDGNGRRDVFVVRRSEGAGKLSGEIEQASVGPGGVQANGPSARPSLDGETHAAPRCVAFQSRATNLTRRDRSSDWDVYVRDVRRRRTVLASPQIRGATGPVVDGRCEAVTFVAGGWVWVRDLRRGRTHRVAAGRDADQQTNGEGVAYVHAGQVWYRPYRLEGGRFLGGRERLVSADWRGRPGNGRSGDPAVDDAGAYIAFESTSTNLCVRRCVGLSRDANGRTADVFRRTMSRRAPTRDSMQIASYSHAARTQGNGPSVSPAISGAGENVVFQSRATNLFQRDGDHKVDGNGPEWDVYSWTFPRRRRHGNVILQTGVNCVMTAPRCSAPSVAPSISSRGNYLGYTSWWSHLCDDGRPEGLRPRPCPVPADAFVFFVGGSHEGHPLG